MRLRGLRAKQKRCFKATTDSQHRLPVAENLLEQRFSPLVPDVVWAADITYIWTEQGCVVLDLFSRRIIGWSMQPTLKRQLVIEALEMALKRRQPSEGLLHHRDRGSQYASRDYQELLAGHGIVCSMSRKGNCYDNAPVERFFATLKKELVHHRRYQSRVEAKADSFAYIEVWYNRKRRHSSLGSLSPVAYELQAVLPRAA